MNPKTISVAAADIFDGSLQRRQVVALAWREFTRSDIVCLDRKLQAVVHQYRAMYEAWFGRACPATVRPTAVIELQAQAERMRTGAIAAALLEILFGAAIASSSLTFRAAVSAMAGGVIAGLLVSVVEAVQLRLYDPERPVASRKVVGNWLAAAALVFLLGFIPLLLTRTVPEAAAIANASVGLMTLGLTTTAAMLAIGAFVRSWSRRYTRTYEALLAERADTERFALELDRLLQQREERITTFAR